MYICKMNKLGIYHLFGENKKAKDKFHNWVKESDEICDYDLENIEVDLFMPALDNTAKYFHFHMGNILDWLESEGYYIGTPLRVVKNEIFYESQLRIKGKLVWEPIIGYEYLYEISNSGVKSRKRALELAVIKAIEHLEKTH